MKHILLMLCVTLGVSAMAQTPYNKHSPTQPRNVERNTVTDSLFGKRDGADVLSDTINVVGGFLFENGVYYDGTMGKFPDSCVLFTSVNGTPFTDSSHFVWDGNTLNLLNRYFAPTTNGSLVITGSSGGTSRVVHYVANNSGVQSPIYQFFRARGTVAVPLAPVLNTELGAINFGHFDGVNFVSGGTQITGVSAGAFGTTSAPSYLRFQTTDAVGSVYTSVFTHKGGLSIKGSNSDTTYDLTVNGTTNISGQVSVGAAPENGAIMTLSSTSQGFLPPRMTGAQAEAISSPTEGLMVYATDGSGSTITSKGWWGWTGTAWTKLN